MGERASRAGGTVRTAVRVEGVVQGVGFRPFVYSLATSLGLGGVVGNDADGVFAEVEGDPAVVEEFLAALARDAPPLARIERVTTSAMRPDGTTSFAIAPSQPGARRRTLVSADTATCADCLAELADPGDRRFGYPFINCTNCGPRFTIVRDVPYDRARTTMAPFAMCELCAAEYHDPADRRFHAQPTCCPACGPALSLLGPLGMAASGEPPAAGEPLAAAAALLREGKVLAVKGLGGYHLAVDASGEAAAAALRARKHREDKPFAVMVADVAAARRLCEVDEAAAGLLASSRRPIVLLPRLPGSGLAEAVAPGNRQLGLMLPYTPLHHLLLAAVAGPMVLTSGNVSDEPIVYRDGEVAERLGGIADARAHPRPGDRDQDRRLGGTGVPGPRGGDPPVPRLRPGAAGPGDPVRPAGAGLRRRAEEHVLPGRGDHAFVSHHIGDLENAETLRSFTEGIDHFRRLFDITPEVVAHDLHPEYLSTKYAAQLTDGEVAGAADLAGVELVGVQHHHAHIASCLADNRASGPVIGVAFDGTGYGTDGTIWGGEFLIADLAGFERAGHLAPVPMPGGAAAIRQPWRMAAVYLDAAYPGGPPDGLDVARRNQRLWRQGPAMARRGVNSPLTSSAGRLFDAVAAILGVRDTINYEGQAAVELEQLADPAERGAYRAEITRHGAVPGRRA